MLVQLQARPDDVDLRVRAAEALEAGGKPDDAALVLAPLRNVTGHEADAGLPCLCKTCLAAAPRTAEASGMQFVRSFAVAERRVLHFWQLADQHRGDVRASVTTALRARLGRRPA
ncbi:MAG TPA: hypothetical protein VFQ65_33960 [Kofleriaceae bacterium]|nr:hypothetical protein [Kofleriaceae bacterium]